jgi:hypothetical protein
MQGSGILGTTAGEEVGLSGLPDRSSVVQLLDFGQSSSPFLALAFAAAFAAAAAAAAVHLPCHLVTYYSWFTNPSDLLEQLSVLLWPLLCIFLLFTAQTCNARLSGSGVLKALCTALS